MYVYLAVTGARVEIPGAISARIEGDEIHFLDSRGVVLAIFRSPEVLVYSMTPIDTDTPPESPTFTGK